MTFLHLAGAQVRGDLMDPAVGLLGSLPIIQPSKGPGMFHGVPKIQNLAAPHKHLGPVPDPLGSVTHDHYHRVGTNPAQLA